MTNLKSNKNEEFNAGGSVIRSNDDVTDFIPKMQKIKKSNLLRHRTPPPPYIKLCPSFFLNKIQYYKIYRSKNRRKKKNWKK